MPTERTVITPRSRTLAIVFWVSVGWIAMLVFFALFRDLLPLQTPSTVTT